MAVREYLETYPLHPLTLYGNENAHKSDGIPFIGTVRKHPYDHDKVLLVSFRNGSRSSFYEFKLGDILHAESRPQIVAEDGESLEQMEIWVKKGAFGIVMKPFVVGSEQPTGIDTNDLYR